MNALTRTTRMVLPRANTMTMTAQRRMNSGMSDFKKNWLMDPGTYPIIVIISFACGFCTFRCFHSLTSQDVRITPDARQNLIRPHQS
mmetsp:Transcript_22461/g.26028  ORF Transcript_22461/g.26028 Transcript_22461/m.26028 type:complete len:87 (-) Transcript_22461:163-423(-)